LLVELRADLLADFEKEVTLCLQVAVLRAAGYRGYEAANRLGASRKAVTAAEGRLRDVYERRRAAV
jgi:transcriptional regulator